jgi:Rrf2 family protein
MKLSSQEEYGLRCLLHLARIPAGQSMTIPEIGRAEGLSISNVAKLMRLLRMSGLITSVRGQSGGYTLARPAAEIMVEEVITVLGGRFFSPQFCERHSGHEESCTHAVDCSLRVLWNTIQGAMSEVLGKTSLADLLCSEAQMAVLLEGRKLISLPAGAEAVERVEAGSLRD